MIFWAIVFALTTGCAGVLFFASANGAVNEAGDDDRLVEGAFREQLRTLDETEAAGSLSVDDGAAARRELVREMQLAKNSKPQLLLAPGHQRVVFGVAALFVAVLALATYSVIGSPNIASAPLEGRESPVAPEVDLSEAVARIEAQLVLTPDDVRGWQVLAPIYMQDGRYADAARAFRRLLELEPVTADAETNLAEALMFANNGAAEGEALSLLESAAARDPAHIRSRFYLAGEATRKGDYKAALGAWDALIAMGAGDEPWLEAAKQGRSVALKGLEGGGGNSFANPEQKQAIEGMVEGLRSRLFAAGGTPEEWTQLVRSQLVLGNKQGALEAYERALVQHPEAAQGSELAQMALENGLMPIGGEK